jgi:hypothetical protein
LVLFRVSAITLAASCASLGLLSASGSKICMATLASEASSFSGSDARYAFQFAAALRRSPFASSGKPDSWPAWATASW